jgi:hypothetical protein
LSLTTIIFALPTLIVALVLNTAAGLLTLLLINVAWLLYTVRTLDIEADGLHFRRVLGTPKFIPFNQILAVEE